MDIDCLPFKDTGYFSDLICDYIGGKEGLGPFYNRYPKIVNFKGQLEEKSSNYPEKHRSILYEALQRQYQGVPVSESTGEHLIQLKEPITFTIVTGHQLNLFTGPLYFLYKIISTINLTIALKKQYPRFNFVPIYWMATEDHDFEEINYFNFKSKKIQWNKDASGAVGRLHTKGLEDIYETFAHELGGGANAETLKTLFRKAYLEHDTLAGATRYLANELFGPYGLVIVDGDDESLKKLLVPYIKKDIIDRVSFNKVTESISQLREVSDTYKIQVNPREINYFYLKDGLRERIVHRNGKFHVHDTEMVFTKDEILNELENHPERFSPNVIARPLYQEIILPNLCYIGGGGELAYWLELKASFEAMEVTFPILLPRNSALVLSEKQQLKLDKMKVSIADLFLKRNSFINKKIREISNIEIDFSPQRRFLQEHFKSMYDIASKTDASFLGAVKAQEVKQLKGLDHLEKRLLKAQKRKLKDHVGRMTQIQDELFPGRSLQERNLNFSELYLEYGEALLPMLFKRLDPLQLEFAILTAE
ncbi:bacillithiol biosynthesis cysteine-adding enzyme BshC [Maribacter polysaccharolyticus]|uniref:bacillithiol biosynthesis cysteine-adding enzyme BshC n=1 Tax=Maribacter polysaccharolyticus TaxID=3020831 RepID=UPI00237F662A|nr:bacillithiol biosynthesis cysteine-adding enzyme BshC [Maribacter polysaccharolyticus]MDE3741354.1 bacillithiol biosynthesis cysteine-adding enzyme BshC [Maribacter polysaccharolyticus]